jgi:hypothetical protein
MQKIKNIGLFSIVTAACFALVAFVAIAPTSQSASANDSATYRVSVVVGSNVPYYNIITPSGKVVERPDTTIRIEYSNISRMQVYDNGKYVGQLTIGPSDPASGVKNFPIKLTSGTHTITVKALNTNGVDLGYTRRITITYHAVPIGGVPNTGAVKLGGITIAFNDYLISGLIVSVFMGLLVVFIKRMFSQDKAAKATI